MQKLFLVLCMSGAALLSAAQTKKTTKKLFIDVHHLTPGKVTAKDVAEAHKKDLAVQKKHNVEFLKYWVDEVAGNVYCVSSAYDAESVTATHREAHGLMPQEFYSVTDGIAAASKKGKKFFLDVHLLGANKVKAEDVAKAHEKDLAVQSKYGVNFINYWVDERQGLVFCLSQASDSASVKNTHKEAHGLMPVSVSLVKQGQ